MKTLEAMRRRKVAEEVVIDELETKRSRRGSFDKKDVKESRETKGSESENLKTEERLEILDTIKELEELLAQ